eukprot:SAG31_NODE_22179_length_532_cov_0.741339_1_plen_39_part_10
MLLLSSLLYAAIGTRKRIKIEEAARAVQDHAEPSKSTGG